MENDDETPLHNVMTTTIAPNHFLLSTYKENQRSLTENSLDYHFKAPTSPFHGHPRPICNSTYKCLLCRKISDDPSLTCSQCVNDGRFCSSRHDTCSSKRRLTLVNMLNSTDQDEFHQYSTKLSIYTPAHLQCSDRMFLVKKFQSEKKILQTEYQKKMAPRMEINGLQEEIKLRKIRLQSFRQSIERSQAQNESGKQSNVKVQQRLESRRSRIRMIQKKIQEINSFLKLSNDELRKKNESRIEHEQKLLNIRRQRLNEVYKYIFPIEHISLIEENLAHTMRALSSAQQPIVDETTADWTENDEALSVGRDRHQIVNSCLPADGDYQIDKLLLTADVGGKTPEEDSVQSTVSYELFELLSGLSHACQLINVIAFYLHITLPFRLHQLEFTGENLTVDRLRADIAKLNANIISTCLSQGIHIDNVHVTRTLENLCKLLTHRQNSSRPKPVIYSQQYIDMMEEEVNEICRAYVTDYWFDDVERDVTDLLNSDEWETVPQNYNFPEDPSIHERLGPLPSLSGQQQQQAQNLSMMSGSIGFLKSKGSNLFNSMFRTLAKS